MKYIYNFEHDQSLVVSTFQKYVISCLEPFPSFKLNPQRLLCFFPWSHGHGKFRFPGDGQVLVLACEHAAPLPEDSLESLVQLCRSLWDATVESIPDEDVWKMCVPG